VQIKIIHKSVEKGINDLCCKKKDKIIFDKNDIENISNARICIEKLIKTLVIV
jgi:hypothetical protein